ncbi:MAG: hypothetical protein IJM57_02740 [Lachnospiraceae bacterium]|nr:hypothetical protein [Lachnospiraceae bacterium]
MGNANEEMRISGMEATLNQWKDESERIRWIAAGVILAGLVLTLFFGGTRRAKLVIWIICLVTNIALVVLDIYLRRMISKGKSELYDANMDWIRKKRELEKIGAITYLGDFDREILQMNIPDDRTEVAILIYFLILFTTVALFLVFCL